MPTFLGQWSVQLCVLYINIYNIEREREWAGVFDLTIRDLPWESMRCHGIAVYHGIWRIQIQKGLNCSSNVPSTLQSNVGRKLSKGHQRTSFWSTNIGQHATNSSHLREIHWSYMARKDGYHGWGQVRSSRCCLASSPQIAANRSLFGFERIM